MFDCVVAHDSREPSARIGNPYVAGNQVGGSSAFVGRADLLRDVRRELVTPQSRAVLLYGQRRIGKTSILHELMHSLAGTGSYCPVYFDLQDQAKRSLGDVVVDLAQRIEDALGTSVPRPAAAADAEKWFTAQFIPSVLAHIPSEAALVVLFDEFDVLADVRSDHAASSFFPYLRELLSATHGRMRFVFVIGRNIDDLTSIAKSLFKTVPAVRVSLLERPDAETLMRMSEQSGGPTWSTEALEEAWALTSGHPFLLQHLCSQVLEQILVNGQTDNTRITRDHVQGSVPRVLERAQAALTWLWDGLPPAGRIVASALAGAGNRSISQEELEELLHESGVFVIMRELRTAPQLLEEWDLIEPIEDRYRFRVELLRQWIARSKPLGQLQRELDLIEPRAENLYKVGELDYKAGDLEGAAMRLQDALRSNPNHARASELLADILIQQCRWGEARLLLEKLLENYPGIARGRLAQVLMALAEETKDDGERLVLLDQVLSMQRKHPGAEAMIRAIWKSRGDRLHAEGQLAEAAEAYKKGQLEDLERAMHAEIARRACAEGMLEIEAMVQRGAYATAYDRMRALAEEYWDVRDFTQDIARLEELAALDGRQKRVDEAIEAGDTASAVQGLLEIIYRAPTYGNATARLHELITGVSIDENLANLELAAQELSASRERLRRVDRRGAWLSYGMIAVLALCCFQGVAYYNLIEDLRMARLAVSPPDKPGDMLLTNPYGSDVVGAQSKPETSERAATEPQLVEALPRVEARASAPPATGNMTLDDLLATATSDRPNAQEPDLPESPTRDETLAAMRSIESAVRACASNEAVHGTAEVAINVAGATGRVTSATVTGITGVVGSCIARAVRNARFPRFSKPAFSIL